MEGKSQKAFEMLGKVYDRTSVKVVRGGEIAVIPKEEVVCGDAPKTVEELLRAMAVNLSKPERYSELRQVRKERFMPYESPDSCQVIYKEIVSRL